MADLSKWKITCFQHLHERLKLEKEQFCNLVVIGDSFNEINAGKKLAETLPRCTLKLVKMENYPQLGDLIK